MKKSIFLFINTLFFATLLISQTEWINYQTFNGFPSDAIYQIDKAHNNTKWLSTIGGGIISWDENNRVSQQFSQNSLVQADSIFSTFTDSQDNLWIASFGEGLLKIDPNGIITKYNTTNSALPSNFVTDIEEDQSGNIWVSTLEFLSIIMDGIENGGIVKISPAGTWTHYSKNNSPLLTNNTFQLLLDDSGNLWIGTINAASPTEILDDGGGLCKLSTTGAWTLYNTENSEIGADHIMSLEKDNSGNIYAGSMNGLISRLAPDGSWAINSMNPIIDTNFQEALGTNGSILNMRFINDDLYVGFGPSDLLCMPIMFPEFGDILGIFIFRDVIHSFKDETFIPDTTAAILFSDVYLRIATDARLEPYSDIVDFVTDLNIQFFSGFPDYYLEDHPVKNSIATSFHVDDDGDLWIGTIGQGLYIFNRDGVVNPPVYQISDPDLLSTTCYNSITESSNPVPDGNYRASHAITSAGKIPSNGSVIFNAGTQISLEPGFEVEHNSNFEVQIDGCN